MTFKVGTNGDDDLHGTAADDLIVALDGNDYVDAGEGDDNISGGAGDDVLWGGLGNDTINGGADNDQLFGSYGNDVLNGGDGNDQLFGGEGQDSLTGGLGADTFAFRPLHGVPLPDSTTASPDVILDFNHAEGDKIDLAALDANAWLSGNQGFNFIGSSDFSGVAGQLRYQIVDLKPGYTDYTIISGDMNGDGTADFAINCIGKINFVSTDFVL